MADNKLYLLGCLSGVAGVTKESGDGPHVVEQSAFLTPDMKQHMVWEEAVRLPSNSASLRIDQAVQKVCQLLAEKVSTFIQKKQHFCVLGGDHTSAIGTWSGAFDALHQKGEIGLIWIDAHMDSHTPETSESGRVHGMPLACLLGYGYPTLTGILHHTPKVKPENVCLIGVRSFERGEAALLKRLGVRIYYMDEVKSRGLAEVLREAVEQVSEKTVAFGMSIDLDGLDPIDAPAVDVPEPDGLHAEELREALPAILKNPKYIGTEIVEFNPTKDRDQATEKIIASFLDTIIKNGK